MQHPLIKIKETQACCQVEKKELIKTEILRTQRREVIVQIQSIKV
jgi:hypothetical protein